MHLDVELISDLWTQAFCLRLFCLLAECRYAEKISKDVNEEMEAR